MVFSYKITHPIMALIDSGADVCFCSDFIAKHLGVNLKKIKNSRTFTTANNTTFDAKLVKINLIFANKNYPCIFYITSSLPPQTPIILGQFGFFDQNKIIFDAQNKKITIT